MEQKDLDFIVKQKEIFPQLSHAGNILAKVNSKLKKEQKNALDLLVPEYVKFLKGILKSQKQGKELVLQHVKYLNDYYNFMHNHDLENIFSAQGKFRPTILEEFLFLLFKDYLDQKIKEFDAKGILDSGAVKAYSNIYFQANDFKDFIKSPTIGVNQKDQDYAIYRTFDIQVNDANHLKIRIPAVAIEAKTYIDKTMLDSIIATAEKIKNGNPHTRFIAVAERYDVSFSVDPAYSRIDQIYVLRKTMRKQEWSEIDSSVVLRLYEETIAHLERPWFNVEKKIAEEGIVI